MFVRKISLLGVIVGALLPVLAQAQEADTALTRIRQNKAVTIGFRESAAPFAYLDENKQASGYSIDICNRIAEEIGRKLNIPHIETRYVPVTPQTRIPLIANGTVDIECGTTVNSLNRQEQVDFSYAVALAEGRMLVKKTSRIQDLSDLNGKIVALAAGTTAERYVRAALDRNKINVRVLKSGTTPRGCSQSIRSGWTHSSMMRFCSAVCSARRRTRMTWPLSVSRCRSSR
jgi:glutamate/aspartate transport system substrate-binding protein